MLGFSAPLTGLWDRAVFHPRNGPVARFPAACEFVRVFTRNVPALPVFTSRPTFRKPCRIPHPAALYQVKTMTDTNHLLREYTASGSEPAFRELVSRYVDLVTPAVRGARRARA
jgi:hypothetical protein